MILLITNQWMPCRQSFKFCLNTSDKVINALTPKKTNMISLLNSFNLLSL